jgi:signal transduction histidine kinase
METTRIRDLSGESFDDLAGALEAGVLLLRDDGAAAFGNARALTLLGCRNARELERLWGELRGRLEATGLDFVRGGAGAPRASLDLDGNAGARSLLFEHYRNGSAGSIVVLRDVAVLGSLEEEVRLAAQMRALSHITPAVAHDLRAPINAMVFNIEILKETLAAGRGSDPTVRDRQLRYVSVLKEELNRLHQALEIYLAQISPRGDRGEDWDLREALSEVAALVIPQARKQQSRVELDLPDDAVLLSGSRYRMKQGLLQVATIALAGVGRDAALEINLQAEDGAASVAFEVGAPAAGPDGAPDFDLRLLAERGTALYVARSILAEYGGRLRWVPGEGNRFEVEFPVSGKE